MLVLKDLTDLKKYLETRLAMARNQEATRDKKLGTQAIGMIYAFEESIRAVDALANQPSPTETAVIDPNNVPQCDVCLEAIKPEERNYQSTADSVVCESCCRKMIERAKDSRRASQKLEVGAIAAGEVDKFIDDLETSGQ